MNMDGLVSVRVIQVPGRGKWCAQRESATWRWPHRVAIGGEVLTALRSRVSVAIVRRFRGV